MNLFNIGKYLLHSGKKSEFKIDCDALNVTELGTLVSLIIKKIPSFKEVIGVPTGGNRLESILKPYQKEDSNIVLIVDDVLTTGSSMEKIKNLYNCEVLGVVIFARGKCPDWIIPIFELNENFREF